MQTEIVRKQGRSIPVGVQLHFTKESQQAARSHLADIVAGHQTRHLSIAEKALIKARKQDIPLDWSYIPPETTTYEVNGNIYTHFKSQKWDAMILTKNEFKEHGAALINLIEENIRNDSRIRNRVPVLGMTIPYRRPVLGMNIVRLEDKYAIAILHQPREPIGVPQ